MLWVVVCGIIVGLFGAFICWVDDKKLSETIGVLLIAIVVFSAIGLFASSLDAELSISPEYVLAEQKELVAMQDVFGTKGFFFLGTGYIGIETYYVCYYKMPGGGTKLGKVPTDKAVIFEEERSNGLLEKYIARYQYKGKLSWSWLDHPFDIDRTLKHEVKYKIYIPEGSISNTFELDLQ